MRASRGIARSLLRAGSVAALPAVRTAGVRTAAPVSRSFSAAANAAQAKAVTVDVSLDGIALVKIDVPGEKVNTMGKVMMDEFEPVLQRITTDDSIKAVVIISGKPDNFIAGADISMLSACTTAQQLTELSHLGQQMMDRLAASKKPTVAAIHGSCLGGGLELALACKYRIATSSPKTKLGLPEVQLGLLPGAGGTQRLPRLVGLQQAITLMTTGQQVKPEKAKKLGLVDEVVDPSALQRSAVLAARELAAGTLKYNKGKKLAGLDWVLEGNPIGRSVLFSKAGEAIAKASGGNYPSPVQILECVKTGVEGGFAAGSKKEREAFGELGMTTVSQALRGIFFSQTATKKSPVSVKPSVPVQTVGILGAGLMGAGIAQVSAVNAGLNVIMKDRDMAAVARGEKQVADSLSGRVKKRSMTQFDKDLALSRIIGVSDADASANAHLARSDLVIEAVPEDLKIKHAVIKAVEPLLKPTAVFATNTSALPIANVAAAAARPERVLGMHYFSPVDKMPLLEIIPHAGTAPEAVAAAFEVGSKQGKTSIVVKDVPGFYVNRCLGPWAAEALYLVQNEGVTADALDAAVKKFGYPVGPVTLADEVGVDVLAHTYGTLKGALGVRMSGADDAWLKEMVANKWLGRKTGKGFYVYPAEVKGKKSGGSKQVNAEAVALIQKYGGTSVKTAPTMPVEDMVQRMVMRFMKECIHSLEDGIIRNPGDGDIGAVFGLGFPPFLGGPFRYADTLGLQKVVDTMLRFQDASGEQFKPPQLLVDKAKAGKKFHA